MRVASSYVIVSVVLAGVVQAAPSKSFRITSFKELDEGEAKGVMLSSLGEASPGLGTTRIEIGEAAVASSTVGGDGTVYLGTGDSGTVYRYRAGKVEKVVKLDLLLVAALVAGGDGTVYAAGAGNGRVFAIDRGGAQKELAKLDAEHVWALALDEKQKLLYAATGPSGKLFSVELGSGKARLVAELADKHLYSMVRGEDGSLFVGSSEQAMVWRVTPSTGRIATLHDFEGDEVKALYREGKSLFVAVNEFSKSGSSSLSSLPPPTKGGTKISAGGTTATTSAATPSPVTRDRKGKGAVYRLDDDGRLEQLLATSDGYFTALAPGPAAGSVYAASGANGKVYLLKGADKGERSVQTAIDVPERQALTLAVGRDESVLGTGDAAALYRLSAAPKESTYTTKVLDAQFAAKWGSVRYLGRGALKVETRSGNAAKPDKTWSAWLATGVPQKLAHGAAMKIGSESGRYLQARVTFASKDALLTDLQIFYTPQNQRPRVTEITVADEAKKPLGVKATRNKSTVVKLRWKTENPDDDELVYRVQYREESETNWKLLGGPDPLTKAEYDWNTESIADGHYVVQVTASDERANAKEDALEHALVSDPLLVDNRKPDVEKLTVKFPLVSGTARDSFSPITEIAYSVDGGDWQAVGAKDGVYDDTTEDFAFKVTTTDLNKGTHTLAVRAVDSADNIAVTQTTFQTP